MTKLLPIIALFLLGILNGLAQEKKITEATKDTLNFNSSEKKLTWVQKDSVRLVNRKKKDSVLKAKKLANKKIRIAKREERRIKNVRPYDALAPSKAAFYSAIIPGLGQAYTGKYWKIPIVYGALGTGVGIALWNQNQEKRVRDVFKDRLRGVVNEDLSFLDEEALVRAQRTFRQDKELSILITIGIYALNIIDANVTAHLQQYNLNKNLSLAPKVDINQTEAFANINYGLALKYQF